MRYVSLETTDNSIIVINLANVIYIEAVVLEFETRVVTKFTLVNNDVVYVKEKLADILKRFSL